MNEIFSEYNGEKYRYYLADEADEQFDFFIHQLEDCSSMSDVKKLLEEYKGYEIDMDNEE